jgi:hypothetical protein
LSSTNSLAARYPRVAAEWHPRRNGELRPEAVVAGTKREVWWRCAKGHAWSAAVCSRTSAGEGCPYCSGTRLTSKRSLAARRPAVAAEWHVARNGALTPRDVAAFSKRKVWWTCSRSRDPEHVWEARVSDRSRGGSCPYCTGQRATTATSLSGARPDVAALWHPTRNLPLDPHMIVRGSGRIVWWRCPKGHVWKRKVIAQTASKRPCPKCALAARR